jgi:hypothetical protein
MKVSRRAALKALAAGVGTVGVWPYLSETAAEAFAELQATNAPPKLAFLSPTQYATVDAVAETIIPADDHSPGARAARVADYIDLLLSESDEQTRKIWIEGLAAVDEASQRRFKAPYVKLAPDQAVALLSDLAKNELNPKTGLEWFFKTTKDATIRGYYTSEIGIHQELKYKGNVFLKEFVGCTHPEHGFEG